MTQDSGYDLKPEDKPVVPAAGVPAGEGGAAAASSPGVAGGVPGGVPVPPGFVVPVPVVLGPDDVDPDEADAEEHRVVAILGYLVFLLPLLFAPKSKFARFHANQALLVFLSGCVVLFVALGLAFANYLVGKMPTPAFGGFIVGLVSCLAYGICVVFGIGVGALVLMGIINASNGEKKVLPVVGKIQLIK